MTLFNLGIFLACILGLVGLFKDPGRRWLMFLGSALAVYWLQPTTSIRYLDFWLPTASLTLTVIVWLTTRAAPKAVEPSPETAPPSWGTRVRAALADVNLQAAFWLGGLILVLALTREFGPLCCYLTPARPPAVLSVLGVVIALALTFWLLAVLFSQSTIHNQQSPISNLQSLILILFLIILKTDLLATLTAGWLRAANGLDPTLATATDWRWLGFSYLAFRLIHVLRDRALGRLPNLNLQEFVTYALFFPAFTAGPIDRVERFIKDLRTPFTLNTVALTDGGARLVWGVFKKFVLADSLALIALNAQNAAQINSPLWLWVVVYAYAWRLYWDFSGYSDIAIGLGRWLGVKLPENFDQPYTRQNLTVFWNSWHITLSQWFRAYVFNPVTRALRARPLPPAAIIFLTQMIVMLLIGLWHGVTWNFVIWGVWHGLGLFVHNRWADAMKPHATRFDDRPRLKQALHYLGVFFTFHYVALGWVWFALPEPGLAVRVLARLFGIGI